MRSRKHSVPQPRQCWHKSLSYRTKLILTVLLSFLVVALLVLGSPQERRSTPVQDEQGTGQQNVGVQTPARALR